MASSSSRLPAARRPAGTTNKSRPTSMFEVPTDHWKRLQQLGDGARSSGSADDPIETESGTKQAKRRSLLPTFSRKASADDTAAFPAIREDTSDSEVSKRPGTSDERKAMAPPPKPVRTTSMRVPGAVVPSKPATSHLRTVSRDSSGSSSKPQNVTTSPQKAESGVRRAGTTRLPAAPSQQAIPTRGSSTRALTSTISSQKRSATAKNTAPVLDTAVASEGSNQTSPTSPTSSTTSRQSATTSANVTARKQLPPPSRPAFSTYQQHFSPAKSALPKPPIPSAKAVKPVATSSTESEIPMTFETVLEQIELLQLSILHSVSSQTMQEFEANARQKLATQHANLQKDFESVRIQEQEQRRMRNLSALEAWCPDAALLAEHLQTLSRVVSDLRGHTEPGSRYSDLTDTFDRWLMKAESTILDSRQHVIGTELLPDSWRSTHTSLSLKLRSIQRDISSMPPAPPSPDEHLSSLDIVLENCSGLVESMLKELEIMTKLHKEVLQQSKDRIDEQVKAVVSTTTRSADKETWLPQWQSVT